MFDISIASEENAILPFRFDLDGILLLQTNAQPVLRTEIKGRAVYVFMVPDGGSFRFEEEANVTGGNQLFTVRKDDRAVDIMLLTREETNRLFILRDGSLILTDAALLEDENGGLRLETVKSENTLYCYPADRLQGKAQRMNDQVPWGVYRANTAKKEIGIPCEPVAPCRWKLHIPENALEGLKDARLQISYQGDIGMLFLEGVMISDNFCNGDTWEVGLLEHRDKLPGSLVLKIFPIREGATVNVESAMAARNEEVKALIAELKQVSLQPVYEINL